MMYETIEYVENIYSPLYFPTIDLETNLTNKN